MISANNNRYERYQILFNTEKLNYDFSPHGILIRIEERLHFILFLDS